MLLSEEEYQRLLEADAERYSQDRHIIEQHLQLCLRDVLKVARTTADFWEIKKQLVYTPRIVIMVREFVFTPQEAVVMVRECGELERLHWWSDELGPVRRHGLGCIGGFS